MTPVAPHLDDVTVIEHVELLITAELHADDALILLEVADYVRPGMRCIRAVEAHLAGRPYVLEHLETVESDYFLRGRGVRARLRLDQGTEHAQDVLSVVRSALH